MFMLFDGNIFLLFERSSSRGDNANIHLARDDEWITINQTGFSLIYMYMFTLQFEPVIDPVIEDMCKQFNFYLAEVGPSI